MEAHIAWSFAPIAWRKSRHTLEASCTGQYGQLHRSIYLETQGRGQCSRNKCCFQCVAIEILYKAHCLDFVCLGFQVVKLIYNIYIYMLYNITYLCPHKSESARNPPISEGPASREALNQSENLLRVYELSSYPQKH